MKSVINLYKPVGLSPLQAVDKFRLKHREYSKVKMGYAGRLDPMAEGVLLVLVGEENKKIRKYLGYDKEYRAEILIGLKSDSCDVLGMVSAHTISTQLAPAICDNSSRPPSQDSQIAEARPPSLKDGVSVEVDEKALKKKLKMLRGRYEQKIPAYSSYRVKGHPMFYYALKGEKIEDVKKEVNIQGIKINSIYSIGSGKLLKYVLGKIDKVDGEFRQKLVKEKWRGVLDGSDERFVVVDVTLNVSSGTYIRAIADDFGSGFGGGLLLSLKRTRVGDFVVKKSERLR